MENMIEQICDLMKQLSLDNQRRVLEYAQALTRTDQPVISLPKTPLTPGISGAILLAKIQSINMLPEDIDAMERALEDCERIEL